MPAARLDTATVFESTFDIYRRQATLLLPAALLVFLPAACLTILATVTESIGLFVLALIASVVAQFWFQGMVVEAVRDILDGRRDYTLDELLRSVTPVLGALVVAGLLAGIGVAVGILLLIVPGLILLTLWALLAPVIVIERLKGSAAFRRSVSLVRGNGFRVFGVIVVLIIIQALVAQILQTVGESVGGDAGAGIGQLIGTVLLAPLAAIAATVMYLQLAGLPRDATAGVHGSREGTPAWDAPPLSTGGAPPSDAPLGAGWAPPAPPSTSGGFAPPRAPEASDAFGRRPDASDAPARPPAPGASDSAWEPPPGAGERPRE